jgi:hypothetical protein
MTAFELDMQCETGQRQLMDTQYLEAISTLSAVEELVWQARDYPLLSRLYLPLQEARRQARLRCAEGALNLTLLADAPGKLLDPERILTDIPHGQLLIAGWGTIEPAVKVRNLARQRNLYVESFLGALFPIINGSPALVILPTEDDPVPDLRPRSLDQLKNILPEHALLFRAEEMPRINQPGTSETFALVSQIWERLHLPFLAAANAQADPIRKMEACRKTIRVDYACELAHQKLAAVAKHMALSPKE